MLLYPTIHYTLQSYTTLPYTTPKWPVEGCLLYFSVFIAIGGDEEYTLLKEDWLGCSGLKQSIKQKFDPSNHWVIDWCNLKLVSSFVQKC